MRLWGPVHVTLLTGIAATAALLSTLCRHRSAAERTIRLALGCGLAGNELIWWAFRYSHEGIHLTNLPLQLCDLTVWTTVAACLTLTEWAVEVSYFAGLAGSGMALLTPDLWSPWPSYPAIYFFAAHGGIVIAAVVLVFGRVAPLRTGAVWRAFALIAAYSAAVGVFDTASGANYMYLRYKPHNASLLDLLGPWPWYLAGAAAVALALFCLLWLPARAASRA